MSLMCFSLFIFYQEEIKKRASSFFQNDLNPHLLPGKFILRFQIYSRNSKIYGSKHRVQLNFTNCFAVIDFTVCS